MSALPAHAVYQQYLASDRAAAAKPWQLEILRSLRFPGDACVDTYAQLQAALDTVREPRRVSADVANPPK